MRRSGRTPLLRAKRLEKVLNVGEIYIKLEGANPTGHIQDRLAEMITMEAVNNNSKELMIVGKQAFTNRLKYYAELAGLKPIIPVFKNEKWKTVHMGEEGYLDFTKYTSISAYDLLTSIAKESSAHLAYSEQTTAITREIVTEEVVDEIMERMKKPIDTMFMQYVEGFSIDTVKRAVYKYWIEGKFSKFPKMITATNKQKYLDPLDEDVVMVEEPIMKEALKVLKSQEYLKLTGSSALSFVAFYQMAKSGKLKEGTHVIVLNDAKTELQIDNINDFDEVSKKELIQYTREWLAQYADSLGETEDAIMNANEKGFILLASRNGSYEGVCIVVHTGFDNFIPTYHLAYIGTHASTKGRGVGTELINKAVELTEGNLSLHVDLDNKGAKKLYEKMGFKHTYNRMLYKG